jgi:alpha-beta hydrolase superfamily lysophospholipase
MTDTVVLSAPGVQARCEIAAFTGAGGRRLRYGVVRAHPERRALLYLHGIESHGGWFLAAAEALAASGCTTYLLDRRGSGLNLETEPGDAESAQVLLEDVRRFRAHAGLESVVLVGLSWGGKLALAAALDQPQGVCALVLVTPGLVPRVDYSWPKRIAIALSLLVGGRARFHVPIEPEMFTRTPRFLDFIANDPLRLQRVTARFLFATRTLDRRIRARIDTLAAPVLLLLAGHDRIIDNERTLALLRRVPDGRHRVRLYERATHSIQFEETAALVRDVERFLEDVPC